MNQLFPILVAKYFKKLFKAFDPILQAVLWHADTLKNESTLEEHTLLITDVRFSPSMPRLATSSFDKTVRVWDADNVSIKCSTFSCFNATLSSKNISFVIWMALLACWEYFKMFVYVHPSLLTNTVVLSHHFLWENFCADYSRSYKMYNEKI